MIRSEERLVTRDEKDRRRSHTSISAHRFLLVGKGKGALDLFPFHRPFDFHLFAFHELGEALELLVFDELFDELAARVLDLVVERGIEREEHARFDVDERRGHQVELGEVVQVACLGAVEEAQVLFGDRGYRYVIDAYLVFFDQEEEEVEGAFEILEAEKPALPGLAIQARKAVLADRFWYDHRRKDDSRLTP